MAPMKHSDEPLHCRPGRHLVLASSPSPAAQIAAHAPGTNHVVFISLDGFMSSALGRPVPAACRPCVDWPRTGSSPKAMRPVNPTVTWANHTSMITGVTPARHGVIFNGLLVSKPGVPPVVEPWRDKAEMVRAADVVRRRPRRAGLTTAQVDWVAIWNAPTITWEFRERPEVGQAIPQEMIKAGLISEERRRRRSARATSSGATKSGPPRPPTSFDSIGRISCCSTCSTSTRRSIATGRARRRR